MNNWWAGLAPRERVILIAGMAVLGLLIIWLLIVEPIVNQRAELRREVMQLTADHTWMQQTALQVRRRAGIQRDGQSATGVPGGSVLTLIEVSASAAGIKDAMERVQPEGDGARLWFDAVAFDTLVRWLAELEQRQGLLVSQLSVDAGVEPGMVSARVLVEPR
ncbi:type II secretion system protein GspM [Halopseudomonas sp.]|uniref:type II secretion system protein GspM n=1 Tax=Halopseudomonas sp. TaxID=2901191 RepID=UPI0035685777